MWELNQLPKLIWLSRLLFAVSIASSYLVQGCGINHFNISPGPTLSVTPSPASVPVAWTQQFSASIAGVPTTAVTWSVNGVAGGSSASGTISSSGLYSAPAVAPVPATISVSAVSQTDSSLTGTASLRLTGLFAYVTNQSDGTLSAYSIGASGALTPLASSPISTGQKPFFLRADPQGKHLYVTNLNASDLYAYEIDPQSGALTQVGLPITVGSGPRAIAVNPTGTALYVSCTDGAGVYGFSIDSTSGALTALPGSPFPNTGLRPAAITLDPSGKFAILPNNASKNVSVYSVDSGTGRLTSVGGPYAAGTAPVWASTDQSGTHAYVLSDVDDAIDAYSIGSTGALSPLAPPNYQGVAADPLFSAISPNGKFFYVVNWFANVGAPFPGSTVSVFSIDTASGALAMISGSPFATGSGPTSIAFEPTGKFAYVTNEFSGTVSGFSMNPATGAMTALPSTVAAGQVPTTIAIVTTTP